MKDIKVNVPHDIKRYITMQIVKRLLVCIAGFAAVALILLYYKDSIAERGVSAQVFAYTVPFIAVLLVTGVPLKLIDRSWCGTIENVKVREVLIHKFGRNYRVAGQGAEYGNVVDLEVRLDSGKTVTCHPTFKPLKDLKSIDFYTFNFKEGDRVVHIYLTNFVQRLPDDEAELINCTVCGEVQPKTREKCETCGHTLSVSE